MMTRPPLLHYSCHGVTAKLFILDRNVGSGQKFA